MHYSKKNGIHIVEVAAEDFKIVMVDKKKKSAAKSNYINANFFGCFQGSNGNFTLPVGHIVCDFDAPDETEFYCKERGSFEDKKFIFNSSTFSYMNSLYGNAVSTLIVSDGKATIDEVKDLPDCDYAIAGIPVMRNGNDVKFATDVKKQGWGSSSLYGTWHAFVGLKTDRTKIYVIGMRTYTANMITSAEAFKKLKALGFVDVIKLDGGGSFVMNVNGRAVASTSENRRINAIITFGGASSAENENPYKKPVVTLKKGNLFKEYNRWLQWQLNSFGFDCEIDGSFGAGTLAQVKAFQKSVGLDPDGMVGPATRAALTK